jgi:hypothetical protein
LFNQLHCHSFESVFHVINMLKGDVVGRAAIRVIDRDHGVVTLSDRYGVIGARRPIDDQARPTLNHVAIGRVVGEVEARILTYIVKVDSIGPIRAAIDCNVSTMRGDEERIVVIGYREIEPLAD